MSFSSREGLDKGLGRVYLPVLEMTGQGHVAKLSGMLKILKALALLSIVGSFSWAWGKVEVKDLLKGQVLPEAGYKAEEGWAPVGPGLSGFGLILDLPGAAFANKGVRIEGGELSRAGEQMRFLIGSTEARIFDGEGVPLYEIRWVPNRKGVIYKDCQTKIFSFRLSQEAQALDFPLAVMCELDKNPPRFTISVLQDVQWMDYELNEMQGKGERNRLFALPSGNLASENVGNFNFVYKDKKHRIPVVVKTLSDQRSPSVSKGLGFSKTLGVGMSSLVYTGDSSYSASSYLLKFSGWSDVFWSFLRFGVNLKNTFNMADDPKTINLMDLALNLGYVKDFGENFGLGVYGQYRSLDYRHLESNARLQSSQMGFGVTLTYLLGKNSKFNADISMATLGSKVMQSHMDMVFGYAYRLSSGSTETWLGFQYEIQNAQGLTEAGASRQFGDSNMILTLEF